MLSNCFSQLTSARDRAPFSNTKMNQPQTCFDVCTLKIMGYFCLKEP